MWTKHHKKRKAGRLILPAVTAAFLSYFGYHSLHGDYGLRATEQFDRQFAERTQRLAALKLQHAELERRVQLMSDGSLDRDMLDEKTRSALNMSPSDEIAIFD
jgi:cell division protein FtsB